MRRIIVLLFTAAALLMAAGFALDVYGREAFAHQMSASTGVPFVMDEYSVELLQSWEKAAFFLKLPALSLFVAGVLLWKSETHAPARRFLGLGLDVGASRRVAHAPAPVGSVAAANVHAASARTLSLHGDDGLTPLERVIRSS